MGWEKKYSGAPASLQTRMISPAQTSPEAPPQELVQLIKEVSADNLLYNLVVQ